MRIWALAALVAGTIAMPTMAHAIGCEDKNAPNDRDELVSDYTKVANRKIDVTKVTAAARALAGQGVFVRVRVFDTLEGKPSIEDLAEKWQRQCAWQLSDGKLPSTAIFIPFAVEKGDIMIKTGTAINARVTEAMTQKAIATIMTPSWQSYKHDPNALTNGLVNTLDSFKVVLAQPLSGGGGGNTTIIHEAPHQAADLGWLKWLVIGGLVIGGVVIGIFLLQRSRDDRGSVVAAQQKARAIFADLSVRMTTISGDKFVSERRFNIDAADGILSKKDVAKLRSDLEKMNGLATQARNAFSRFLPDQEKDPNPNGLSASAYQADEQACADMLVNYIEPAEELARSIDEATNKAHAAA